jgi:hypothetical protein
VDWPALEAAITRYTTHPDATTAAGVTSILPKGGQVELTDDPAQLDARGRIYQGVAKIDELVGAGAPEAANVAFALRAISDGTFTDLLDLSLGGALSKAPEPTLRALAGYTDVMGRGCRFASALDPAVEKIQAVAELDRRRSAVEAVTSPDLRRPRACVTLELGRAIDAY